MKTRTVGTLLVVLLVTGLTSAFGQVTIDFEDGGIRGLSDFSTEGSTWTGGVVATEGIFALYSSGRFSYEIDPDGGSVTLATPVESVSFFFVHGSGFAEGTASAFDNSKSQVGVPVMSNLRTSLGDPANFVLIESGEDEGLISRVEFTGGVIDDFSFPALLDDDGNPTGVGCNSGVGPSSGAGLLGDILSLVTVALALAAYGMFRPSGHRVLARVG